MTDVVTAKRDDTWVLLALCPDPAAIVPNGKLVDMTWTHRTGLASSARRTRTATTSRFGRL